jgi:hypothetical protein
MAPFLGMRGTGDWPTDFVPTSFAEYMLFEQPNGSSPLFAMTSQFKQETTDSYKHTWAKKTTPTQAGTADVYIDAGLGTAYVYATHAALHGAAGKVVYVKVTEALSKEFNVNATVILRDSDQEDVDVGGIVVDTYQNGASSWVSVRLQEADGGSGTPATYNLSTVDRILRIGNAQPDGSVPPESIAYDADTYYNYVQNFRNTLDQTLEDKAEYHRFGDAYVEAKRETAELHSIDIEKSAFWGRRYAGTGDNGQPLRTTEGCIEMVGREESGNVVNFRTNTGTDYAGKTWKQAGGKFLNTYITQLFRYMSSTDCLAFCGDGALLGIQELAETYGQVNLTTKDVSYGLNITQWRVPAGVVNLKTHPLFSHETTTRYMMVLMHPKNCRFCPKVGGGENFKTKFEKNMQLPGQHTVLDGWTTKGSWKWMFPKQFMVLYGVGQDNTV